jgi:regulator of nucleoside diphosphate kinase
MSDETCILTTKDLTILEVLLDRCLGRDDRLVPVLRRKINSALVMFRDDVPENVATLSSRVAFSVDGKATDSRIISHEKTTSPTGMYLPITSLRGLALLGLAEGQEFRFENRDGVEEPILLEKILYQPEAARRAREAAPGMAPPKPARAMLRLVSAGGAARPEPAVMIADGFDDPGPSAA